MAAAMAMSRPSFRDTLLGTLFGDRPGSVYMASGPVAEREMELARGHAPYGERLEDSLRARLRDLISGAAKVGSVSELVSYLKDRFITPEIRSYGTSQASLHLRDQASGEGVSAAAVHSMFSPRGMRKLADADRIPKVPGPSEGIVRMQDAVRLQFQGRPPLEYEAIKTGLNTALSSRVQMAWTVGADGVAYVGRAGVDPRKPLECLKTAQDTRDMMYGDHLLFRNEKAAHAELRAERAVSAARVARGHAEAARAVVAPLTAEQRAMPRYARAMETARSTVAEARTLSGAATQARQSALALRGQSDNAPTLAAFRRLPVEDQTRFLSRHYVFDAALGVRTAIVMRTPELQEAGRVHPSLTTAHVASVNGVSYRDHCAEFHRLQMASRAAAKDDDKVVVDFEKAAAALRESRNSSSSALSGPGFGGVAQAPPQVARSAIVIVADDTSPDLRICRHSPTGEHAEMPQVGSLHNLKPGEYRLLVAGAVYDAPSGYVVVDEAHGVTFLDAHRREHSLDGPSHIPASGNRGDTVRWSIDGQSMDKAAFEAHVPPPPPPAPDDAEDRYSNGFGFGSPT
jgi:hypothetical protein